MPGVGTHPARTPGPEGKPYQPYQPYQPSVEPVRLGERYGSTRTTEQAVPPLTSTDTTGTAGTTTPPLRVIPGGA